MMVHDESTRLVIIVSNGPLLIGRPETLAGRPAIYMPVASKDLPLPAIATTLATGVDPTVHGIVTFMTVDIESLNLRKTEASDRRFPPFWLSGSESGIHTALVNWPATEHDEDVTLVNAVAPGNQLEEAKKVLSDDSPPQIIGIVIGNPDRKNTPSKKVMVSQQEVESFLSFLGEETNVMLVHRRTDENGRIVKEKNPLEAVFLVDGHQHEIKRPAYFSAIGGAIYSLTKIPCPLGVFAPKFTFLSPQDDTSTSRTFPPQVIKDSTDWLSLINRLKESQTTNPNIAKKSIMVLATQFGVLSNLSLEENKWKELERYSEFLIHLTGTPREYWYKILSLHQQDKRDEMQIAIEKLNTEYPDLKVSLIAKSIQLVEQDGEKAIEILESIDPTELQMTSALGTFGRMCMKMGLTELGIRGLALAIKKSSEIPSDRAVLAQHFYTAEEYKKAMKAIGIVGLKGGDLSWRLLRLRILVALHQTDEAKQLAHAILEHHPANPEAMNILDER